MIKLCANISRKVPIPGTDYSSQQFGAAMELEVSDGEHPETVQQRLRDLFELLRGSVDEQIAAASASQASSEPVRPVIPQNRVARAQAAPRPTQPNAVQNTPQPGNGNGNGGKRPMKTATVAQQRAIFAISKALGLDLAGVLADYSVADPRDLTVRDASTLIDWLKRQETQPQQ